jgi:hypothetical protein
VDQLGSIGDIAADRVLPGAINAGKRIVREAYVAVHRTEIARPVVVAIRPCVVVNVTR